ncbi:Putative Type III restriction enzyme, res subunit [endosymbiont DhMRE of Dentiscutata heterogama]|uniref:DEAD/DEAH box helicase n=1 Tax=endosymbiont DhMRE of Dentiscutata heterogama TaxID=1609546 RepID=UPI000629D2E9|nr:DEAD/DEAH box helicase family protein [endosymbiont DhMRE of Dentiscutata heterogama]CFW92862.1 Putative Type III restriction enzyme, res subunit [endosymbiont DhMRE of Dentiscutata heterogama]
MNIKLYPYQEEVVNKIEEKFDQYLEKVFKQEIPNELPFVCFLKSITGSGKTAMLTATANRLLKKSKNTIVLWLSYSKVVVEQTLKNLPSKLNPLIPKVEVYPLSQLRSTLPTTAGHVIYLATTSTFNINVKNKEDYRLIYDKGEDEGGISGWELLKQRTFAGEKRKLFIIYDEGHHFTSQQVDMLLELEPEGIILASGTPTYAGRLGGLIKESGQKMEDLIVAVPTSDVVGEGLIKTKLRSIGYDESSSMGEIINSLIEDLNKLNKLAKKKGLSNLKAIYVCKTNLLETETRQKDNLDLPFEQRKSPPILIWWHLVDKCKIDPRKIAVCARVDFNKDNPPDKRFNLFDSSTKNSDYQTFLKGKYEHIIFNKGLLEGWDDPLVYMAYIDRNIGGDIQAEQLIGRVLRMPERHHYEQDFEDLNTAYFHIKANSNEEFKEIVKKINKELENTVPEIKNEIILASEKDKLTICPTRKTRYFPKIGTINEDLAKLNIQYILENKVKDYSKVSPSFVEPYGGRTITDIEIGKKSPAISKWEKLASYNKVSVKDVLRRNIIRINPRALDLTDFNHKIYREKLKFPIGVNSDADNELKIIAREIVNTFMNTIKLITAYDNCKPIPSISINKKKDIYEFDNSVHQYYSNLNPLEEEAAKVIDGLGLDWTRNPVFSGYGIPLLSKGTTKKFYPDFLVWLNDDLVVAIETTGKSLLQDKIDRKLFKIESFDREKAKAKSAIIPPSKVVVGVITTTNKKDKYQVYQVNENNQPVPVSEAIDMEECVKLILETV